MRLTRRWAVTAMAAAAAGMHATPSATAQTTSQTGPLAWSGPQLISAPAVAISCHVPTHNCALLDEANRVLYPTGGLAGGRGAWSFMSPTHAQPRAGTAQQPRGDFLRDVSCTYDSCVLVGSRFRGDERSPGEAPAIVIASGPHGAWLHTELPALGLRSVACPVLYTCAAGGRGVIATSTELHGGAGAWRWSAVGAGDVLDIDCPSMELCVGVTSNGMAVTSTTPFASGAVWKTAALGGQLRSVSCPTQTFCAAVGDDGALWVSSQPTGDAPAWTRSRVLPSGVAAVTCPSAGRCVAGGVQVYATSTPTSRWHTYDPFRNSRHKTRPTVTSVACISTVTCAATTNRGHVITAVARPVVSVPRSVTLDTVRRGIPITVRGAGRGRDVHVRLTAGPYTVGSAVAQADYLRQVAKLRARLSRPVTRDGRPAKGRSLQLVRRRGAVVVRVRARLEHDDFYDERHVVRIRRAR